MQHIDQILNSARGKILAANSLGELQQIKIEFLGRQSLLNLEMKKLGQMDQEQRKAFGEIVNAAKDEVSHFLDQRYSILEQIELEERFVREKLDLTIPARPNKRGTIHPITQATEELVQIFSKFAFEVKTGPNIESDWYNFTALNFSEDHPARQMHDSFYLNTEPESESLLLRTHTSPIQIRTMQNSPPPFRIIAPGRTYRSDSDMTHTPMFHQIEGLMLDKNINMGHLKYVITEFIKEFFEQNNIQMRFRPSFFPFTEPSCEVDIKMNDGARWLEVLGCGMVHPNVLRNVDVDPVEYQGFAFGLGIERFAMLKYAINDLRQFFESDLRWIKHYSFSAFDIPSLAAGLTR